MVNPNNCAYKITMKNLPIISSFPLSLSLFFVPSHLRKSGSVDRGRGSTDARCVGRVSGGLAERAEREVGLPRQKVGVVQRADSWADRWNDRRIGFSKSSARIPILSQQRYIHIHLCVSPQSLTILARWCIRLYPVSGGTGPGSNESNCVTRPCACGHVISFRCTVLLSPSPQHQSCQIRPDPSNPSSWRGSSIVRDIFLGDFFLFPYPPPPCKSVCSLYQPPLLLLYISNTRRCVATKQQT